MNICKIRRNQPFPILTHQMGRLPPSLSIVWSPLSKLSFDKSLLGTYYVPSTMHTKIKTNTPIYPQGTSLIWQLNAALT